jgi:uncharacterized protein (TIGR03032 family)
MDPLSRPIFIVAPPQSGSSYLQAALEGSVGVHPLDAAQRLLFDAADELRPAARGHDSNRRMAADATPEAIARLRDGLRELVEDDDGELIADPPPRLLDATPRHALRVPFLDAVFPDAVFVYLYREPRDTLASMVEAWRSEGYVTYPDLPDWPGPPWSLLLVEGWRELAGQPLHEIVAAQWLYTTRTLLADLEALEPHRWCVSDFEALIRDPANELGRLCAYLELAPPVSPEGAGSPTEHVLVPGTKARDDDLEGLQTVMARTTGLAERARDLIAKPLSPRPTPTPDADSPLSSVYSAGFAHAIERLEGSLVVSSRTAHKLICVRFDGTRLNTHFRNLDRPAGVAATRDRITVSTAAAIWDYRLVDGQGADPEADSWFLVRNRHYTGEADVHGLAIGAELWLAATRFDCLATLDDEHSFVARWLPPGVDEPDDADRCHLTGLVLVEGRPAFVTALGKGGAPGGWRAGKLDSGVVISVDEREIVADGLCLPSSPCWHDGRLWLLESGRGALVALEPDGPRTVAELPGYARGLAISGGTAFVGVSRTRPDPADPVPVSERVDEPVCGIWALDIETGNPLGYLRFSGEIDELEAVAVLPGHRYPELARPSAERARSAFAIDRAPLP